MWVSDVSQERRDLFSALGVHSTEDNLQVVKTSEVVLIAVKPDKIRQVLLECCPEALLNKVCLPLLYIYIFVTVSTHLSHQLFVSIAAGITLETLQSCLPPNSRVIRVMPNMPCLASASGTFFDL